MTAFAASESETNAVFGGDDDVVQIGLSGVVFAELAAIVVGASLITAEYTTGMIRTTLTATQSRLRVLARQGRGARARDVSPRAGRVGGRVPARAGAPARPRLRRARVPAGRDHRSRRGARGRRNRAPADRLRADRARRRHRAAARGRADRRRASRSSSSRCSCSARSPSTSRRASSSSRRSRGWRSSRRPAGCWPCSTAARGCRSQPWAGLGVAFAWALGLLAVGYVVLRARDA